MIETPTDRYRREDFEASQREDANLRRLRFEAPDCGCPVPLADTGKPMSYQEWRAFMARVRYSRWNKPTSPSPPSACAP